MKTNLIGLVIVTVFSVSCSSKKTTISQESKIPKEVVLSPELVAGKNLYENSCVKCHKLYEPKAYSQEKWKPILIRMQKKAHLDDIQMVSISNYISSQL